MFKHLVLQDFLERAETVFPNRVAVVDEPAQPAKALPDLSLDPPMNWQVTGCRNEESALQVRRGVGGLR